MITVSAGSPGDTTATLTAWEKSASGHWSVVVGPVDAWLGSDGIGRASEDSSHTPEGTWTLTQAFGRAPDPGTRLPYLKVDEQDWWDSAVDSPDYNTHVRSSTNPGGASENLFDAGAVYDHAVVIDYNTAQVPGAGSAFFLHVSGGEPTAGCVSIPEPALVSVLRWLDPAAHPVIRIGIDVPAPADGVERAAQEKAEREKAAREEAEREAEQAEKDRVAQVIAKVVAVDTRTLTALQVWSQAVPVVAWLAH